MLFLNPTYVTALMSGLRILELLNELWFHKKAVTIINFQPRNFHTSPLFKQKSILKFKDKICSENILFVNKSVNNLTVSVFNTWFCLSLDQQNYETSSSRQGNLLKSSFGPNRYGKYSVITSAVDSWNRIQKQLKNTLLTDLSPSNIKAVISNFYIQDMIKTYFC